MGHRDHVATDHAGANQVLHLGDDVEDAQYLLGHCRQPAAVGEYRGRTDQFTQELHALQFVQRRVVGRDPKGCQDVAHGIGMDGRFLSDVQAGQIEAAGPAKSDQVQ